MGNVKKSVERNGEIVTFFYMILGYKVRSGMNPEEARKEAYDAVTLRYEISTGRLLNIISEYRGSQSANLSRLRQNALALIRDLQVVNNELDAVREKNERLISVLNDCLKDEH